MRINIFKKYRPQGGIFDLCKIFSLDSYTFAIFLEVFCWYMVNFFAKVPYRINEVPCAIGTIT